MATRDVMSMPFLTQAGVFRATLEELLDAAILLECDRRPSGRRIAIRTNAGARGFSLSTRARLVALSIVP
jgi:acyl-CoA synthetase (NDP forming)